MTIEASLRKRARNLRIIACLLLLLAVAILLATYAMLPRFVGCMLYSTRAAMDVTAENPSTSIDELAASFGIGIVVLGLGLVAYGCVLLGGGARTAARDASLSIALADALCLAGDKPDQLEKTLALLVQTNARAPSDELLSLKSLEPLLELVKGLK